MNFVDLDDMRNHASLLIEHIDTLTSLQHDIDDIMMLKLINRDYLDLIHDDIINISVICTDAKKEL